MLLQPNIYVIASWKFSQCISKAKRPPFSSIFLWDLRKIKPSTSEARDYLLHFCKQTNTPRSIRKVQTDYNFNVLYERTTTLLCKKNREKAEKVLFLRYTFLHFGRILYKKIEENASRERHIGYTCSKHDWADNRRRTASAGCLDGGFSQSEIDEGLPEAKGYALHLLPPSEPQRNG